MRRAGMTLEVSTFKANYQTHEPHAEVSAARVITLLQPLSSSAHVCSEQSEAKITAALPGTANTESHIQLFVPGR